MHQYHILLFPLVLTFTPILSQPIAKQPTKCTSDFTSWTPPVITLPDAFTIAITSQTDPASSFTLSLPASPNLPGYSTVLSETSTASPPKITLYNGTLLYDTKIFGRNWIEDKSTLPKKLLFLDETNVRDGGFKFEAVYVCGEDGIERRVLKKVASVGGGTETIAASPFEEGGELVVIIVEGQVLKPDIWLEVV